MPSPRSPAEERARLAFLLRRQGANTDALEQAMRMSRAVTAGALLLGSFVAAGDEAESNTLSEAEAAAGFALLFDGTSMEGWTHEGNWAAAEGAIAWQGKGGPAIHEGRPLPEDFELRFEWKISERGNSGVYYRPGQVEYQILDNARHLDGGNPRTSAAALYFCVAPARNAARPAGEWNSGRVVCQGSVIQHWLNGEKVIDFDYRDPRWAGDLARLRERGGDLEARGGFLKLQDNGDPVWYRSLKLRAIPPGEDIGHQPVEPAAIPEEALEKERVLLERIRKNREARQRALRGG